MDQRIQELLEDHGPHCNTTNGPGAGTTPGTTSRKLARFRRNRATEVKNVCDIPQNRRQAALRLC